MKKLKSIPVGVETLSAGQNRIKVAEIAGSEVGNRVVVRHDKGPGGAEYSGVGCQRDQQINLA